MNTFDMTTGSAAMHRDCETDGAYTLFTATIGGSPQLVRGLAVWSIEEALTMEEQVLTSPADPAAPLQHALMHDLTAARLIAPPRLRRRRDRGVASRAALLQAAR